MSIIQDAMTSLMGANANDNWQEKIRASKFRGVPFALVMEEGSHGRRQAVHEYPYRDTAWVEDLGRGTRRFVLRGFLLQNSQIYGGGDVIAQRQALIAACETRGSGTLNHPTLGELTVSVPENGLRISGAMEHGRVFEFTLTVIESGLKVFAVTENTPAEGKVHTNYLKLVSTTVASTLARIRGEIRSGTQTVNILKSSVNFWSSMAEATVSEVTNVSHVLNATFGNHRYGRYSKGLVGGRSSAVSGTTPFADVDDERALTARVTAQSVMDRKTITGAVDTLKSAFTPEGCAQGVADVVNAILNSAGSVNDRIAALEKLAFATHTAFQPSAHGKVLSAAMNTLIVVICSGAMARAAADARPASRDEAEQITQRVARQMDLALVLTGDRADDGMYDALLHIRSAFLSTMSTFAAGLGALMQVTMAQPLPALTLANRLYQDASRADELVQGAGVPHPAFMPLTMKVLRK